MSERKDREDLEEILAKTSKQASVSTTGPMAKVVRHALNVFEDSTSVGEAYRRALSNWYFKQQEDSKRGALRRLEENVETLSRQNAELLAEVKALREAVSHLRGGCFPNDGLLRVR